MAPSFCLLYSYEIFTHKRAPVGPMSSQKSGDLTYQSVGLAQLFASLIFQEINRRSTSSGRHLPMLSTSWIIYEIRRLDRNTCRFQKHRTKMWNFAEICQLPREWPFRLRDSTQQCRVHLLGPFRCVARGVAWSADDKQIDPSLPPPLENFSPNSRPCQRNNTSHQKLTSAPIVPSPIH